MTQPKRYKESHPGETARIVLVSRDPSLIEHVTRIVVQIERMRLVYVDDIDALQATPDTEPTALVVLHMNQQLESESDVAWESARAHVKRHPGCAILVISEYFQPLRAVRYIKEGAADFLPRPVDLRRLAYLLDILTVKTRHAGRSQSSQENAVGVKSLSDENPFLYTPGEMQTTVTSLKKLAPLDTTILLTGETGTGKSRLARLVHELSPRRELPCVVIDCGAVSWQLLESEMFGHVKGAFTGADHDRSGKLAAAGMGTLIIEEIDVLPMELQTKFLRAIEDRVYHPVGSTRESSLEARLIVTTNRSLREEIAASRFRADLYYRINVVSFHLPELRDRRNLIPSLAKKFADDVSRQHVRESPKLSEAVLQTLQAYDWPGNIRELRNVMERCVTLASNELVEVTDLPEEVQAGRSTVAPPAACQSGTSRWKQARFDAERDSICSALDHCKNNRTKTALELGISRVTLYKKLRQLGLM